MEVLLLRHSVRNFTDESVPDEQLIKFVHVGISAPSAMNYRPSSQFYSKDTYPRA